MRIDVLPDDVLLDIFDFYVHMHMGIYTWYGAKKMIEAWQLLVHVCRRWRNIVFRSPRRLNLRLVCTLETPAKYRLDVWPTFPLIVQGYGPVGSVSAMDNVIAGLGQCNRVCQVAFSRLAGWQLENVLAAMQVSFPELTRLHLRSGDETPPVIPDSFLGGSAPRLQFLQLNNLPFPGLPNLLLSATQLVDLQLYGIPHSGYISPKEMVAFLTMLSSLKYLCLEFQSPQSRPNWESQLPPRKRSILLALRYFRFRGVTEYLEQLVACIDTPQLGRMDITFFNQIDFDFPRLTQFIYITPTLRACDEAHVRFDDSNAEVELRCPTSRNRTRVLWIRISCKEPDWQLSSIEQACNSSLPTFSTVEDLYIERRSWEILVWKDNAIENSLWLEVLLPFTAVKNLYLSTEFAPGIAAALQELVGRRMTEVLPSLRNIFVMNLEDRRSIRENIGQFVAARQLSDQPIAISNWDTDST